jgi:hypothetical protein
MRIVVALIFAALAAAASLSAPYWSETLDVQAITAGDELTLAKRVVADLRSHNFADANAITEPAFRTTDNKVLAQIGDVFPKRREDSLRVTAWHKFSMRGIENTNIEIFYYFGKDGVVRAQVSTLRNGSGLMIHGAHINSYSLAQLHFNDFRFPAGALDIRWVFLAVAWLFDAVAFTTFALCLMSPVVRWRWRWLWAIFVLAGALRLNLDWMTLDTQYQLLMFIAPPAQFFQAFSYGSWVLTITAPVGALIYWAKRVQWRGETVSADDMRGA